MSEYNDEEYDEEEYDEEEEVVEKKETSMVEKIIHAVLAPLVYTPLIMLALIYLFSMNMEKFLYIDKKLPYCKKNFAGVWKSYNINYKDYYRKMNPWSIFNFIFNEDKSCSGGGNFLSYYLGKYYYNMILLPSNKLHYFLKYWLSPDSITIDKMKKLIGRSPEVNIKNPNKHEIIKRKVSLVLINSKQIITNFILSNIKHETKIIFSPYNIIVNKFKSSF